MQSYTPEFARANLTTQTKDLVIGKYRYRADIGTQAISSLTKYQGVGDLYRIYVLAQRDEIGYNLAFIPLDFHPKRTSEFDTHYMNQEFDLAYNLARSGYKWYKYPPGFEPANS